MSPCLACCGTRGCFRPNAALRLLQRAHGILTRIPSRQTHGVSDAPRGGTTAEQNARIQEATHVSFAIAKHTGFMYEARGGSYLPLVPTPMLSHARIVDTEQPVHGQVPLLARFEGQRGLIFREDQFDPVTRTRRGRLYEGGHFTQPSSDFYALPHPHEVPNAGQMRVVGAKIELFVYISPSQLIARPEALDGAVLGLGTSSFETRWRVIGAEMVGYGDLLVTLRSLSGLGMLPNLEPSAIPTDARAAVKESVDQVVSAAFRETAGAVVDQCRHALTAIISTWLYELHGDRKIFERDLGDLCKILWRSGRRMLAASAWVVARLHNKTKPSARAEHGLQAPVDDDAQYCIQVVGLVLRELGWARAV